MGLIPAAYSTASPDVLLQPSSLPPSMKWRLNMLSLNMKHFFLLQRKRKVGPWLGGKWTRHQMVLNEQSLVIAWISWTEPYCSYRQFKIFLTRDVIPRCSGKEGVLQVGCGWYRPWNWDPTGRYCTCCDLAEKAKGYQEAWGPLKLWDSCLFWDPSSACKEVAGMGMVKVTCWRGCAQPCSGGCVPPSCWQFLGSLPMCSTRDKTISLGDGAGCLPGSCFALGPTFQALCRLLPWDASVPFSLAVFDRRQGRSLLDL